MAKWIEARDYADLRSGHEQVDLAQHWEPCPLNYRKGSLALDYIWMT
jgi:hypothetical protein